MPAIHLFRRRTLIGGDDLSPLAFVIMAGRLLQVIFLCMPVLRQRLLANHNCSLLDRMRQEPRYTEASECYKSDIFSLLVSVWIGATVLFSILSVAIETRIVHWSRQGTPTTEVEPRSQKVAQLLEYKLVPCNLLLFVIWTAGLFAVSADPMYNQCKQQSKVVQRGTANMHLTTNDMFDNSQSSSTAITSDTNPEFLLVFLMQCQWASVAIPILLLLQIAEVFVTGMFLWQLYRLPMQRPSLMDGVRDVEQYNHELVTEMWTDGITAFYQCLSASSCYMFGGYGLERAAFGNGACIVADMMECSVVLDVVPSDVAAGLLVLQRLQLQRMYKARRQLLDIAKAAPVEPGVVVVPKTNDGTCRSTMRRRTSKLLVAQEEGLSGSANTSRAESEESLLSLDATMKPVRTLQHSNHHQDFSILAIDQNRGDHREERALLNRNNFEEMYLLDEAARYAKYALAIYSWVLYLYVHPISGPARLWIGKNSMTCCCPHRRRHRKREQASTGWSPTLAHFADESGRIEGDNLCQTHKNAILLTAGLEEADLVYVQLKNSFQDNPYCIILDHAWKSVVVSIRGSFSVENSITYSWMAPESLEQLGEDFGFDATGQYCHGGFKACARNVYGDLQRHGLLDKLLLGDNARYPGYTLRLVGHSLGAAICTLISYMLRPKFPDLRCVNYSPPGCTLTWEMATQCKDWCTSCVLDTDFIPRWKAESMERLRVETLELVGRIKVPKVEVARRFVETSALWEFRLCNEQDLEEKESLMESMNSILYEPDQVPDSEYQRQLDRSKTIQEERCQQRGTTRAMELYPPGRILHLVKTGEKRSCAAGLSKVVTCFMTNIGSQYVPVWVNNDGLNEIVVSPTMVTDHFPDRVRAILEEVADDFGMR